MCAFGHGKPGKLNGRPQRFPIRRPEIRAASVSRLPSSQVLVEKVSSFWFFPGGNVSSDRAVSALRCARSSGRFTRLDSDLAEAISALRAVFAERHVRAKFGKAEATTVEQLKAQLKLPRRFREFLLAANPENVETRTPAERVKLISAQRLAEEQQGFAVAESGALRSTAASNGWRAGWIIIAHSSLLGDPYFLDVSSPDAEGDCPVYTAMSGTDTWKPRLCASSFAMFLRILAIGMDVAKGFPEEDIDMDDEQVFREALGPKIREYDPAALKAGHWT